ncbi:hypothetical protein EJF36_11825 [Bacillus sp. HMF5848]|uniref:glycosyl-4,4'-diaponeurosporenoate acyltransferase CrtO family protein n=1 Tax=Bacillus sp. HMF5848 TaxID=2495421 RepID=UPI000F7A8FF2|nr:hypothetical protein [Bacillus sp. HMF5848]RSK27516.1 hypothetical protein EJF36_11825 [Bacillus sp. HMF5848]
MIALINVLVWGIIHTIGAYIPSKFNEKTINFFSCLYPVNRWEVKVYEKLRIKKWKEKLPDGGDWVKGGIKKREINVKSIKGVERFIFETKRAELSHIMQILPAPIFFTFNDILSGWIMIVYAFCFNTPFIMIQRYNRYRLLHIMQKRKRVSFCQDKVQQVFKL